MRKCATMGLLSMAGKPRIGEVTRCEPTSAPSQQSRRNRGKHTPEAAGLERHSSSSLVTWWMDMWRARSTSCSLGD